MLGFWICQGYTRFWIKYFMIDVWQYSKYALDSEYSRVLDMLGLHMILNKILHHRYLAGFWIVSSSEWTHVSSSEYASVTQGSVENMHVWLDSKYF